MSTQKSGTPLESHDHHFNVALESWNVSAKDWLLQNDAGNKYDGVAAGNVVFNGEHKVLVVQRASHDSSPSKWEFPGGAVDDTDLTILSGAARELWEEAGLVACRFTRVVPGGPDQKPGEVFCNSTKTKTFICFTFHVEVTNCDNVKLDANEHQNFVWASETEIRERKSGHLELSFTTDKVEAIFLEAFRLKSQEARLR